MTGQAGYDQKVQDALPPRSGEQRSGRGQLGGLAYERIRDMIASGAFPPSMPVREVDLVRLLQMSRTPIREALQRLQADGLVIAVPGGGYVGIELGRKEMADIYQVREVLTGLAARLAAENRTRVDLARLEDAIDEMEVAAAKSGGTMLDESIRTFFRTLSEASKNAYLHALNVRMVDLFRYRTLAAAHPDWLETARRETRAIVDAIAARDASQAEKLARRHISKALARRQEELDRQDRGGSS